MYSENPSDFPNGSVYFVNLVLANATSHTQNRYQSWRNWNFKKKILTRINPQSRSTDWKYGRFVFELKILTADKSAHGGLNCSSVTFGRGEPVEFHAGSFPFGL